MKQHTLNFNNLLTLNKQAKLAINWAGQVSEISVAKTETLVTRIKTLCQKWHNFCLVCTSTLGLCELALMVKLQESTKPRKPPRMIFIFRENVAESKLGQVQGQGCFITVFVDTRLWKTKHQRKRFQNFHQSYVLLTDRIEIHQSQPLV